MSRVLEMENSRSGERGARRGDGQAVAPVTGPCKVSISPFRTRTWTQAGGFDEGVVRRERGYLPGRAAKQRNHASLRSGAAWGPREDSSAGFRELEALACENRGRTPEAERLLWDSQPRPASDIDRRDFPAHTAGSED